jgi:hypothetical protein
MGRNQLYLRLSSAILHARLLEFIQRKNQMKIISKISRLILALSVVANCSALGNAAALTAGTAVKPAVPAPAAPATYKMNPTLPLAFEANRGQADAAVKFFARAGGYNLYLTPSEAVMSLRRPNASKPGAADAVRMSLAGSNLNPVMSGLEPISAKTSYFLGNDPKKWLKGVENFSRVELKQVYPGIDLVYYGNHERLEHDFIVAPGADPRLIRMDFKGGKGISLDAQGNLILKAKDGKVVFHAPILYQMSGATKIPVQGRYALSGKRQVRFEVGTYDHAKTLVIDPSLIYSTFLGGTVDDAATAIAVDGTQQAYVTGWAISGPNGANGFPAATNTVTFPPALIANVGGRDVFVAKLSADGATLLWLAWLGGAVDDTANAIALDSSDISNPKVFIAGVTASGNFPVKIPTQVCAGMTGTLAFVAELTQPGNVPDLVYSTCLGGVQGVLTNTATAIAVDSLGSAYVTGTTFASNFPIVGPGAPFNAIGGSEDAFITKYAPSGAVVAYSMYMGTTNGVTRGNAIAVDANFHAWVAGQTTASTLPSVLGHFTASNVGTSDAFVAEVNPTGTGLLYATYINGNSDQAATAIALNHGGATPYNVFVAGWTVSPTGFPSTAYYLLPTVGPGSRSAVYQKDLSGADDPFVLRLDPFAINPAPPADNPQEMIYATHLGATGADRAAALALDSRDDAYIAGFTVSSDWTLASDPVTPGANGVNTTGATTSNTSGGQDAFVAAIGPTGLFQPFFSYLGATPGAANRQNANGIAIDSAHNIYVAGLTGSAIFPIVTGSVDTGINRGAGANPLDAFVTKIAPVSSFGAPLNGPPPGVPAPGSACSGDFIFPSPATGRTATIAYCMQSAGTVTIKIYNEIGDLVDTIRDTRLAGFQSSKVTVARMAPGLYFYIMTKHYNSGAKELFGMKKFVVQH